MAGHALTWMGEHLVGPTEHEVLPFFLGAGKMKSQANGGRADSHDEIVMIPAATK